MTLRTICSLLCCVLTSITLHASEQSTELNALMKLNAPGLNVGDVDVQLCVEYSQEVQGPDEDGLHRLNPRSLSLSLCDADGRRLLEGSMHDWGDWYLQQLGTGPWSWFLPAGGSFAEPQLRGALKDGERPALQSIFEETTEDLYYSYLIHGGSIFQAHPAELLSVLQEAGADQQPALDLHVEEQPEGTQRSFHLTLNLPAYRPESELRELWESFFSREPVVQVYLDKSPLADYIEGRRPQEAVTLEVSALWDEQEPLTWTLTYSLLLSMTFEEDEIEEGSLYFRVQRTIRSS